MYNVTKVYTLNLYCKFNYHQYLHTSKMDMKDL